MKTSNPGPIRRLALLAAAAAPIAAPSALPAQEGAPEGAPLVKSEVVRLLVSDTYEPEERREIVRRSCLTFVPTESDMEDFRRLGADPQLLEVIRECAAGGGATPASRQVTVPARPGEVAVSPPAVLTSSDTDAASFLGLPTFEVELRRIDARPSPPGPDRDNLLARVDVPPRLRNPAEVQRLLNRSAPDGALERDGVVRSVVWVFVTAEGTVGETRLGRSSGLEAFDRVALEVARSMRFAPATSGTQPVETWVQQSLSVGG